MSRTTWRWPRWVRSHHPSLERPAVDELLRAHVPLADRLWPDDRERLIELVIDLVDDMSWEGVDGQVIDDTVRVVVAANALMPVLRLGNPYRNVGAIIVRPDIAWTEGGADGGIESDDWFAISGEAAPDSGPVLLAWDHVIVDSRHPERGENVVIHEFAHKLDMLDGDADGVPPVDLPRASAWQAAIDAELAEGWHPDSVVRPATFDDPAEMFAALVEVFVCRPELIAVRRPELYALLSELFAVDPVSERRPLG